MSICQEHRKAGSVGKIRAVCLGLGVTGATIAQVLVDKGVEIVGAVAVSTNKVGRDIGEVANLGFKLGVPVESDARLVLTSREVDIAVIATQSYMSDVADLFRACAEAGVNAITIAEEAIYPWRTSPEITAELDLLAKENGCTLTGSGFQDSYLVNMIVMLMGTAKRVDTVVGRYSFNVDDYGPEVAKWAMVGTTTEEFEQWLATGELAPSWSVQDLDAIAAASGLTVKQVTRTMTPDVAEQDTQCKAAGMTVPAGRLLGLTNTDTLETEQGVTLSFSIGGRVYLPGETDDNLWELKGDPDLWLENPRIDTARTTITQCVNRIPDVICARPGWVTVVELPPLRYRHESLDHYLA